MQMIGKIMKTENFKISSVAEGAMVIKQRMSCKRVLLVLDDVDDYEQLEALAGSPRWFCPGSLIIFTGKDKQLLRSHSVDEIHDMNFLDQDKSLELFYSFAFEEKTPSTGFKEVSEKVVRYVQGHPLALKVLGRFLYGKTVGQWVSELDRLKLHPNEKIQRVLRLSYDGLDLHQKNILLDIACLFIGENSDFVASILDGCNFFADTNMRVLVDKSLIKISSNMSLQMHDLIQAMARAIVLEESILHGKHRRLLISSNVYDIAGQNKVAITEAIEVLVLSLEKFSQKVHIDANDFAHMKKMRILKIYQKEKVSEHKHELKGHNVIFSGNLYYLSNELSLLYWHGCPFKYLPSDFYPENIVAIDLSFSNIKHFWTTPKCFRRLKVMKLRYCCNLTTTPDFSEITYLEELSLEGCVNLVRVHSSIGMLKRLVVLNLTGCLKVDQLPEVLGRIRSITELHMDKTVITELPSFVSSLINLESLSFGGQGRSQPRWWNSIPFGLLSKRHPQRLVSCSLASLRMLKSLNLSYCNLLEVPESIEGLSCLERLNLEGNNFTSLPGSLSQLCRLGLLEFGNCKRLEVLLELPHSLDYIDASHCDSLREVSGLSNDPFRNRFNVFSNSPKLLTVTGLHRIRFLYLSYCNLLEVPDIGGLSHLEILDLQGNHFTSLPVSLSQYCHLTHLILDGCKKLEMLPVLPPNLRYINASDCTSLRELSESSKDPFRYRYHLFLNCPKLFKNVNINSDGSIPKTECIDSSKASEGSIHHLFAFLGYLGFQTNRCEFFRLPVIAFDHLGILYYGNSIPEWFTNRSMENHVKIDLPSGWCYDKFRGYGICVVFKCKIPFSTIEGYYVKNSNGASITIDSFQDNFSGILTNDSYAILLWYTRKTLEWEEAKNFVTFCFQENNENIEVKECGVRLICDEDIQQERDLCMLQGLPPPTQHTGFLILKSPMHASWSCYSDWSLYSS